MTMYVLMTVSITMCVFIHILVHVRVHVHVHEHIRNYIANNDHADTTKSRDYTYISKNKKKEYNSQQQTTIKNGNRK
jgi:hypothetical protein